MDNYYNILFPYAYNIIGSVDEANDAIQDVMLKFTQLDSKPENEKNYLIRGVINQSINRKRNWQRTEPIDSLPQPITTTSTDITFELKDLVSYSLLILLDQLNPKERAVFILKEAFAYTHDEIAEVLSVSVENARQLLSRARSKLEQMNSPMKRKVSKEQFKRLELFTEALESKNLEMLHQLFHEDIVFRADGGKKVKVVSKYLQGWHEVSSLVLNVYQRFHSSFTIKLCIVNHQPAILYFEGDQLRVCQIFEMDMNKNKITAINAILDPDKLKRISQE